MGPKMKAREGEIETVTAVAVPLVELRPAPWNPRSITEERFKNLCDSIRADTDFLWRRPVLAQADGTIYAGNMRYRAAQHLGMETIPALVEDVSDRLARGRALRDNAQWGEWEEEELASLLARLGSEESNLDILGFDERDLQKLLDSIECPPALGDPGDLPALPDEPETKAGDLWLLGDHRLLCSDATSTRDVATVMAGEQAVCLWTDPPYGVEYEGGTKRKLTLRNDSAEGLSRLLEESFAALDAALASGAAVYIAHPAGALSVTFGSRFLEQGWRLHQTRRCSSATRRRRGAGAQGRRGAGAQGRRGAGAQGEGAGGWYGGNDCSSVFEVPRPKASPDHPTSKPVALVEAMVTNSSRSRDIVLDGFLGSGSTLIACERAGRRCFGLEIDSRYVDVAVRR